MNLVPAETSLVIAGAWNPAIVTPEWMLKFGLEVAPGSPNVVQAFLPAVQGMIFEAPKYVVNGMTFSVRPDALIFACETAEGFELIETVAARIVDQLKHTPMRGVGHNFEFRDPDPAADHVEIFTNSRQDLADHMPDGWQPATSAVIANFSHGDNVAVNIARQFEGNGVSVKFNFHHALTDSSQVAAVLRGHGYSRMSQNLDMANDLIGKLYGVQQNAEAP